MPFNTLSYTAHKALDYDLARNYYKKEMYCDMADMADMDLPSDDELSDFVVSAVSLSNRVTKEKKDEYYKAFRKLCEFLCPIHCPEEGSFIGWKIGTTVGSPGLSNEALLGLCLIELEIPEDAKRSSCYGPKCRCDKAMVKSITELKFEDGDGDDDIILRLRETDNRVYRAYSAIHNSNIISYTVGQMVEADSFNKNRWRECSGGIHFFVHKARALQYAWEFFMPLYMSVIKNPTI